MAQHEHNTKLPMSVGTIYKRIFLSFLTLILLLISFCVFSKYKICRFPFDVLYGPSQSIEESKEKGVFITEYLAENKSIVLDSSRLEIKEIWMEKYWFTMPYTNEVDPKSFKIKSNHLNIYFNHIYGNEEFSKYRCKLINNDGKYGNSSTFWEKKVSFNDSSEIIPDKLKLVIYKSDNNNGADSITVVMKRRK
jgi:hypothetical protein